ncbi:MAG: hypothetical protein V4513_00335 [Pseudomonadota bacterium]
MTDWFYAMPIWAATIVVLGASLGIGLAASLGVKRVLRLKVNNEEREVAINLMQVVAAYVGIMIAFAGVQVWQDFTDSKNAVSQEAATAAELYQDLTIFGPETLPARQALRDYVASVNRDEWPMLSRGEGSGATLLKLHAVFNEIGKLSPTDNRSTAIYSEMLDKLNSLVDYRRQRIVDSRDGIPAILWAIGIVGGLLTVAYASAFTPTRYNVFMTAGIALTLGLLFLFILTVNYPYKGEFSVGNRELVELSAEFEELDRVGLHGQATELR